MPADDTAHNKAMLNRLHEAFSSGDEELIAQTIDEVFEPDVELGTPLPLGSTGTGAVKEVFATLHRAFPDLHIEVEDVIAEGDRVVCRNTVTGTHQGTYLGVPPTGIPITYREIIVGRFSDSGRIAETWALVDVLAQMRQLGMVPEVTP
ncbi:ester cyclase [Streptomyces sp. 4N509B]|uniref:ester cyclase n=1 Tax=Streptomyces sp. 4N509B TaxID=3457413 RepID=UPI003FCFF19B